MRRKLHNERGVVLIFVAISLVLLAAFVALAIDVGFMFTAKADLQSSVDAAALAGASGLTLGPAEARARAIEYAQKNPVFNYAVNLELSDIELGTWNASTRSFAVLPEEQELTANSIRVTGNLTEERGNAVELFFARVLGRDTADVRAQSVATAGVEVAWDVVVLQDITGSFTEEIDTALDADRGLLGCIADNAGENSRVGFAVHTGWGLALTPLWSIEDGYADLSLIIDGVDSCGTSGMPPCSGTDQAAGMESALEIFAESGPNTFPSTKKAIVLVSDGHPNASSNGAHPTLNDSQLADLALEFADDAFEDDIHIFTVFYDDADDDDAAEFLEDMTRGIGTFQRTPDPDDLGVLLGEVCSALVPGLRLVE
jgi:Flp pilus assembly protein TadG